MILYFKVRKLLLINTILFTLKDICYNEGAEIRP